MRHELKKALSLLTAWDAKTFFAWLEKRQIKVLWTAIAVSTLLISWLCFAKYARLGYDGFDLAYFNQVFWNTVRGRPFSQTLHPHLSLGDHAELAIILLAPFYAIFQDPRTLLFLQSLALALGAWPVFLLARDRFADTTSVSGRSAPLIFGLAWLANPLLQNIALFEFHLLPFALTPLMFALLAYRRGRKGSFLAWTLLALLCREDVALVIMTLPLLAWIEKKPLWWKTVPLAVGSAWFIGAMKLVGVFAPGGGYKFNVYYDWLGSSLPQVILGAIRHPLLVVRHVATVPNFEMIVGFLMPYLFLPMIGPTALILALGPLAQILLGAPGGGEIVLDTHYATLFLPALTLAAIDGYRAFPDWLLRISKLITPKESQVFAIASLLLAAAYGSLVIGPVPAATARALFPGERGAHARTMQALLSQIPPNAAVAASYALMPHLSSRERFYSAHYLFLGETQFGQAVYPVPADLRYTLFDLDDLVTYQAQFPGTFWTASRYAGGAGRLESAIGAPIQRAGRFILFDRLAKKSLVTVAEPPDFPFPKRFDGFELIGATTEVVHGDGGERLFRMTTRWDTPADARVGDLNVRVELRDHEGKTARASYAAFDGLTPASLRRNGTRLITVEMPLDGFPSGDYVPSVALERRDLSLIMDADRSTRLDAKKTTPLGIASLAPISVSPQ